MSEKPSLQKSLKQKLLKETGWSFATKFMTLPLFFLLNIMLARYLGKDNFGAWSYFYSFFSVFLLIAFFGIRASTKFLAEYNGTPHRGVIINTVVRLRLVTGVVFACLMYLLAEPLAGWADRPEFARMFRWGSLPLFFLSFTEFMKGSFAGLHKIKYNFLTNALEHGSKLLLVFLVLQYTLDHVSLLQAYAAAGAICTCVMMYLLYRDFYSKGESFTDRSIMKEVIQYSIPLFFISIGFTIATEIDTLMLGKLSDDGAVGDYAIAKQIVTRLPHISQAIAMGTMPVFAKLSAENAARLKALFYRLIKINIALFGFIIAGILLTAGFVIPFLYGAEFNGAILPLRILCIYLSCASFLAYFNSFLDFSGKAKIRMYNLFFSTLINIGLNYYLIPIYGASGAAIATSISYFPYLLLNAWETRQVFKSKSQ